MKYSELKAIVSEKPYTTNVARAFRLALGLPLVPSITKASYSPSHKGLHECFRNATSPMDRFYGQP